MKSFVTKTLLFFSPFIFGLLFYVSLDPFKVVRNYDEFYNDKDIGRVVLDKDYVSTTNFVNNYSKEKYDSFIFGNSRSMFYQISDWKKHLESNSIPYHFDASGETLFSLHKKITYLDNNNIPIKNSLLILDHETLNKVISNSGHLGIITPRLVNYNNFTDFHYTFLEAFFNIKFMYAYLDFKTSNEIKPYMKEGYLIDDNKVSYNHLSNEFRFTNFEKLISKNEYYNEKRLAVFYKRDTITTYTEPAIFHIQKEMLEDIYKVFSKNKTKFKIIINPLYNQEKLAKEDLLYLKSTFGASSVFDYSGINEITRDFNNYYEASHYRPHIANKIMNEIYK